MKRPANANQYILPFEAARDELLLQIRLLRFACLEMTRARQEGIVQLLERLALLANDCRESDRGMVSVRAQVSALAARISARSTTSERTIQRWTRDAILSGVLVVEYCSHQYGRREWNHYHINVGALRQLCHCSGVASDDLGVTRGDTNQFRGDTVSGPRGDTVSGPRGDTVSGPSNRDTIGKHSPPQPAADTQPLPAPAAVDTRRVTVGAVERVFLKLGVGKAVTLIAAALDRGCDTRSLLAIARWFERSQRRHPRRWRKPATVLMMRLTDAKPDLPAWYGWIPGEPPRVRHSPRTAPGSYRAARRAACASAANDRPAAEIFRERRADRIL